MKSLFLPHSPTSEEGRFSHFSLYQRELFSRLGWLVHLRWYLALGLLAGGLYLRSRQNPSAASASMLVLAGCVLLTNLAFAGVNWYLRHRTRPARWKNNAFAFVQLLADLTVWTLLVHWTGGIQSVFVIFFVFNLVIASVLLRWWFALMAALIAVLAVDIPAYLESTRALTHHAIAGLTIGYAGGEPSTPHAIASICIVYNIAFLIVMAIASTISERLRYHEARIEEINRNLEEINTAKSYFMRTASHEMRSPLTAVRGLLEILEGRLRLEGMDMHCAELIRRCTARVLSLNDLIGDLLAYSQLQSVSVEEECKRLNWADVLARVVEQLEPVAHHAGVDMTCTAEDCHIVADEEQIFSLTSNLLGNAIRYTPAGGKVEAKLHNDSSLAVFEVADTGIGVDSNAIDHIFDEFFRAPNAKEHETAGTGLGLTLCKRITEGLGGTIDVTSLPHERTVFTVRIPKSES